MFQSNALKPTCSQKRDDYLFNVSSQNGPDEIQTQGTLKYNRAYLSIMKIIQIIFFVYLSISAVVHLLHLLRAFLRFLALEG